MGDYKVTETGWKFLRTDMRSDRGNVSWKLSEWQEIAGKLVICENGFHLCSTPLAALGYVKGEIIARVEGRGEHVNDTDKSAWREMRVTKAWHWRKEDSVALAIFAAERVLPIFEGRYPKDDRPRKAIAAAKAWLTNPTEKNRELAAASASAAYAAASASASAECNQWVIRRTTKLERIK